MAVKRSTFTGKLAKKRKYGSDRDYGELTASERKSIKDAYVGADKVLSGLQRILLESELLKHSGRRKQDAEMLRELLKHFNIPYLHPDKYLRLSLELARLIVPGFQYEKAPRGRKNVWGETRSIELLIEVEQLKHRNKKLKTKDAIALISKQGTYGRISADSLYNRYLIIKKETPYFPYK